jgi:two-component system cell cycle response regulator DivK
MSAEIRPLILIADDDVDTRDMYGFYLKQNGFRIAAAGDGEEALNKASKLQPNLVVMDLAMPKVNGDAATRILKSDPKTKHIPVVLLTGYAIEGANTVRRSNCDGFLIKPCEPESLLSEVRRVLAAVK